MTVTYVGSFADAPVTYSGTQQFNAVAGGSGAIGGYDATNTRGRRKSVAVNHKSEDDLLKPQNRAKLLASSRDLARNFSLAQWAIGQHLNYVTQFRFHPATPDKGVNERIEELYGTAATKDRLDARRRHSMPRFLRLMEAARLVDGDIGIMKLSNGSVQPVESDRIRDPDKSKYPGEWIHGVQQGPAGSDVAYAIHKRKGNGFEFERVVSAKNFWLLGYFKRFDQVRGISPWASGLNSCRDVYENIDHALARSKLSQYFALLLNREVEDNTGDFDAPDLTSGPGILDLGREDKASFLESKQPSQEFQQFMEMAIMLTLRAVDIPYSFFREDFTNFFGSRAALMHYERSCKEKRDCLIEWLHQWTQWQVSLWILNDQLKLPRSMKVEDIKWKWVPLGTPWWDPAKEIRGDLAAVQAGMADPYTLALERTGNTYESNIDATVRAIRHAREVGQDIGFRTAFDTEANPILPTKPAKKRKKKAKK